jgi:hypothetical protein
MSQLGPLGHWQTWASALLLASVVYAILKIKVSPGTSATQAALAGLSLAREKSDMDYAKIGLAFAAKQWQQRKRWLLAISLLAGVVLAGALFFLVPAMLSVPAAVYGLVAVAGVVVLAKSKY